MTTLEQLIPVAVVGTARRDLDVDSLPAGLRPAGRAGQPAADALLAMAARAAIIDKVTVPAAAGSIPAGPAVEHRPAPASPEFVGALQHALTSASPAIVMEALGLLGERGRRLPVGALHGVLEAAVARRDLRPLLSPVLGARGEWLVRLNPRWQFEELFAPDPDVEDCWLHGTRPERVAWLTALRGVTADRARETLAGGFAQEDAQTRAALLATLHSGLGPADEPFLESALDDRGREVRAVARRLLSGLPDSAYVQRMRARLAARVNPRPGARWQVDLTGLDADDRRDGLGADEPRLAKGKQAAEAYAAASVRAMVAGVPLSTWAEDFGYPAVELVGIPAGSTELGPLPGLRDAALREGDAQVAAAMLARLEWGSDPALVRCLDPDEREAVLPARVRAHGPAASLAELQAAAFGQNTAAVLLEWLLENRSAGQRGAILAVLGSHGPVAPDPVWDLASLLRRLAGRLTGADQNRAFQAATTVNLRRALAAAIDWEALP